MQLPSLYKKGVALSAALLAATVLYAQNPDAVFPLPANYGTDFQHHVNLVTGSVNMTIPLIGIQNGKVSFSLGAFYNSRTAALINQNSSSFVQNALGGFGWKLLDYPKIVSSAGRYYFLDGYRASPLAASGAATFNAGGKFYLWQVQRTGAASWDAADPNGKHFVFAGPPVINGTDSTWSFTTIKDALWGDSLNFSYTTAGLSSISSADGDTLLLAYANNYLQSVTHTSNGNLIAIIRLSYLNYSPPGGNNYLLLSSVRHYHQIYGQVYDQLEGGYNFTYQQQGTTTSGDVYPGALSSVTDPKGARSIYTYKYTVAGGSAPSYNVMEYALDDGYDNNSGDTTDRKTYTAFIFDTTNSYTDTSGIYRLYNLVKTLPGGRFKPADTAKSHPYGSVEYYFLNGKMAGALKALPADYNTASVGNANIIGYRYFTHIIADTSAHNNDGKDSSVYYWSVGSVQGTAAGFPRLDRSYDQLHGVGKWLTYSYGTAYNLLTQVATSRRNPEPLSPLINKDSVVTTLLYGFQQYPALAAPQLYAINLIIQEIQTVQEDGQGNFNITSCNCTQWSRWNAQGKPDSLNGNWAPRRKIIMRDSAAVPSACFSQAATSAEWIVNTSYQQRNAAGMATDSSNAVAAHNSAIYAASPYSALLVAGFENASVAGKEAGYLGFESYESRGGWNIPVSSTSNYPHTGKACVMPNTSGSPWVRILPARQDQPYIFAIWYRNKATAGYISYQYFDSANNRYTSKEYTLPPSSGEWRSFSFVLDFPAERALRNGITLEADVYIFARDNNTDWAVDDMRYYPVNGRFSAQVTEINREYLTATLGMNHQTTYFVRDRFNTQIAQLSNAQLKDVVLPFNSRQGNITFAGKDSFSAVYPNMELRLNTRGSGRWEAFANPNSINFPDSGMLGMQISNSWLLTTGASGYATFSGNINETDIALYTEVFPDTLTAGSEAGFSFMLDSLSGGSVVSTSQLKFVLTAGQVKLYYGNTVCRSQALATIPNYNTMLVTISHNNLLIAYLNGRYVFECYFPNGRIKGPAKLISSSIGAAFDNFIFIDHVQATLQTFDALMRPRQTLVRRSATELQVSEILYGGPLNLPVVATRQAIIGGANADSLGLSYKPNFASGFNYDSMTLSNKSVLGSQAGFKNPFEHSVTYTKSPLLQLNAIGGGAELTAGIKGNRYTNIAYGNATGNVFNYTPDNLISVKSTRSDSTVSIVYTNREELPFAEVRYKGKDTLKTQYEYDRFLRVVKIYQPNYYNSNVTNNGNFIVSRAYDFTGNKITESTTDAGTTRYVYDAAGRLRFKIDSAGIAASPDTIVYIKYDPLGRVMEEGILKQAWNAAALQAIANSNGSYPAAKDSVSYTWRKKYRYDRYNGDSVYTGYLVHAAVNWNNDTVADVKEYFTYNSSGYVREKGLQVLDFDTVTRTVVYDYDRLGHVTSVQFPGTGNPGLVYRYDGMGNVTSIGVPGDSTRYATYSHGYSLIERLNRERFMRSYNYTEEGWINSINDQLFNETIAYHADSSGHNGTGRIKQLNDYYKWNAQLASTSFTYDNNGRLTVANLGASNPWSMGVKTPLSYDNNGNLLSLQTGTAPPLQFQYNAGTNKINTVQGFRQNYAYNGNGSVVSVPYGPTAITYDPVSQRTLSMQTSPGNTLYFEYNGKDQRVLKTIRKGSTTSMQKLYVHGLNDYPLYEVSKTGTGAAVTTFYVYGPTGLIAISQGNNRFFVLKDHLRSTRIIVDTNNAVIANFNYNAYGTVSYSAVDSNYQWLPLNYLYTGQEFDAETGLYNYRARLYDPGSSRFYSTDPEYQYPSPYVYAGNNPVSMTDPTGTWSFWSAVATVATVVAVVAAAVAVVAVAVLAAPAVGIAVATTTLVIAAKVALVASATAVFSLSLAYHLIPVTQNQRPYVPPPAAPPIVATDDGIAVPVNVTKADFGVNRPIEGRYSIIDLNTAHPFVPDNSSNASVHCPQPAGTPSQCVFPYRPIIAATGQMPNNPAWTDITSQTLYVNANFFDISGSLNPYAAYCTNILGPSFSNNQSIANWETYGYWGDLGSCYYYLDALVIFKPGAPAAAGRKAAIVRYKDLTPDFFATNCAYAVGGIYYIRNGIDTSSAFSCAVSSTSPKGRTAIGVDNTGRYLLILEVDSKLPGVSEGLTFGEMAIFFKGKGYNNVINLDGDGSSAFYYKRNATVISSKPMDIYMSTERLHRPIPNFLGFK